MTAAPSGASSVGRSAMAMGAVAALSRAFGGVRMVVVAAVLGTTFLGNAFQSANSLSNVLFELLAAGALSAVLVPTFVELLGSPSRRDAEEVAGGVLTVALVTLGVVSLLGVVFAPQLAAVLVSGVQDPHIAAQQRELVAFLLRFFVPQVLLYAVGAVATAVLHAQGRFAVAAAAPIGNTVVIVASMLLFSHYAGADPGLDLPRSARLCLAVGGTLGVAAFVGAPWLVLRASGFRMRVGLRRAIDDARVHRLLRLAGWAALLHSGAGLLLGAAIVSAGGTAGGVVAYQLAMVVFLAPYGILAQPIHTAVLPRLAAQVRADERDELARSVRWAIASLLRVTIPVAAGLAVLALPIMRVLAFGDAASLEGVRLLAAALAGLGLGVPVYGGFLLLARVSYALGDSRTPAVAGIVTAAGGGAVMLAATGISDPTWRMAIIAGGHTLAYLLGSIWLGSSLRGVVGGVSVAPAVRPFGAAVAVGLASWWALSAWSPSDRWSSLAATTVLGGVGAVGYFALLGRTGRSSAWS